MANYLDSTGVSGNSTYGLKALSLAITSVLLNNCPALAALGMMSSNKADELYNVGSPDTGILLSGAKIDPIRRKEIVECSSYSPLTQIVDQQDVKDMGYRDTSATLSLGNGDATYSVTVSAGVITAVTVTSGGTGYAGCAPTLVPVDSGYTGQGAVLEATISGGQVTAVTVLSGGSGYSATVTIVENSGKSEGEKAGRTTFKWSHKEAPCYVYERDTERYQALKTTQRQLFDAHMNTLANNAEANARATIMQKLDVDLLYGTGPTSAGSATTSSDDIWKHQYGIATALDIGNYSIYGGVDRSLAANYMFRPAYDTAARNFTLEQLWKDAHITKGIAYKGGNIDVFMVGPTLFNKWFSEAQSYQVKPSEDEKLAKLRQWGFEGVVIKHNTSYVMSDVRIKDKAVYGLCGKSWVFATKSGKNFSFRGWKNQAQNEGGKQADYNTCDLQYMLFCEGLPLNCFYSNVT